MLLSIAFVIVAVFSISAQFSVNSTFKKYSGYVSRRGYTADEVARQLLINAGIYDVRVEPIRGNLTDHYDPGSKTLRLSQSVYGSRSIAAIGVAAHETGHAIQHNEGYSPLSLRNTIFPVVNIGSKLAMPLVFVGCLFYYFNFSLIVLEVAAMLFSFVVIFHLITLPVEFNASSRAIALLDRYSFLDGDELNGAKKVLKAAAMTYVAATASSIIQLLRIIVMIMGKSGRRRD
ncbi:MAG: zinc metallopeptidase [Firmicutes bacterium]|nr:zinc metallopeptidase [Bacillota bacterium]